MADWRWELASYVLVRSLPLCGMQFLVAYLWRDQDRGDEGSVVGKYIQLALAIVFMTRLPA